MREGYAVLFASALLLASVSACVPTAETGGNLRQQCEAGDAYACREWRERQSRERVEREQARRAAERAEAGRRAALQEERREAYQQNSRRDRIVEERQRVAPQGSRQAAQQSYQQSTPTRAASPQPRPSTSQQATYRDKDKNKACLSG